MRGRVVAKVLGHILLSVLFIVISGIVPGILVVRFPYLAAYAFFIAFPTIAALLIPQWCRQVPIKKRLMVGVVGLIAAAIIQISWFFLAPIMSGEVLQLLTILVTSVLVVVSLRSMNVIDSPFPIPFTGLWRGEIGLAKTYWFWNSFVGGMFSLCLTSLVHISYKVTGSIFLPAVLIAITFSYALFLAVSLWRSARRYRGRRAWAVLSQIGVVFGLIMMTSEIAGISADIPQVRQFLLDPASLLPSISGR
jgi:hypothetical protein